MTSFSKIRKPFKSDQPYIGKCLLGWVPYGRDSNLKAESLVRCNYIRTVDEKLEKRLDTIIYESFAEKPHDSNVAPSLEDKMVLRSYEKSVKNVGDRFEMGLPFNNENVVLPVKYIQATPEEGTTQTSGDGNTGRQMHIMQHRRVHLLGH